MSYRVESSNITQNFLISPQTNSISQKDDDISVFENDTSQNYLPDNSTEYYEIIDPENIIKTEADRDNKEQNEDYTQRSYNSSGELVSQKIKSSNNIIEQEFEDGIPITTHRYLLSDDGDILKHTLTDEDGQTTTLSSRTDSDDGVSVDKNFTSPDGTQTYYSYEKDNNGSSSLSYQIVDKDGNLIMNTQRTYEKISDNEAVSTYNGKEYYIKIDDDIITIDDLSQNESTQLNLDSLIEDSGKNITDAEYQNFKTSSDNEDFKEMIKSQPGDVLINLSKELNKIGEIEIENGAYNPANETLACESKESTFNHELGHAIDYIPQGEDRVTALSTSTGFQKVFQEEIQNFVNSSLASQIDTASYLLDPQEFAAEARMLNTTNSSTERAEIIQTYFPKSTAYINALMDNIDLVPTRKFD